MPFIKTSQRKLLDKKIDQVNYVVRMLDRDKEQSPAISYIILRLLEHAYDSTDIKDLIEAIGVLEEIKLNYALFRLYPKEVQSLTNRFMEDSYHA